MEQQSIFNKHEIKSKKEKNKEFYEREEWIANQKSKYPNEIIAFMKKNEEWKIVAYSPDEIDLLEKIDQLIKNSEISPEDRIIFRKF